ncbi:hypothetical protein JTE90_015305 [Oedothorax gibbosus]|uniref:Uncharacterized protein n=1 Tax=Oedothorax gibbosus TaxID=931172 RepID=A0AAV6VPS3_9ARAC|nr:hypothetical protein JTE90_015305 [Oedothorax gibbosus]
MTLLGCNRLFMEDDVDIFSDLELWSDLFFRWRAWRGALAAVAGVAREDTRAVADTDDRPDGSSEVDGPAEMDGRADDEPPCRGNQKWSEGMAYFIDKARPR